MLVILVVILIMNIKESFDSKKFSDETNANIDKITIKINEEKKYFDNIKNKINEEIINPFIPEGFKCIEKNIEEGFVIEDENGNQYVWVPCLKNNFKRSNYSRTPWIIYQNCYNDNYEIFIKSILENGGFYISRFEIGIENNKPVSKKNTKIWKIENLGEANKIVDSIYETEEFKYEIINGLAYDSTLNWIFEKDKMKLETNEEYTGKEKYKNIYDILDNNFEITIEKSFSDTVVYRGFLIEESNLRNQINFKEYDNRFVMLENEKQENLAIRTIIYK